VLLSRVRSSFTWLSRPFILHLSCCHLMALIDLLLGMDEDR
jgi:hypothetical protein